MLTFKEFFYFWMSFCEAVLEFLVTSTLGFKVWVVPSCTFSPM